MQPCSGVASCANSSREIIDMRAAFLQASKTSQFPRIRRKSHRWPPVACRSSNAATKTAPRSLWPEVAWRPAPDGPFLRCRGCRRALCQKGIGVFLEDSSSRSASIGQEQRDRLTPPCARVGAVYWTIFSEPMSNSLISEIHALGDGVNGLAASNGGQGLSPDVRGMGDTSGRLRRF
jgi:hypothetical protein